MKIYFSGIFTSDRSWTWTKCLLCNNFCHLKCKTLTFTILPIICFSSEKGQWRKCHFKCEGEVQYCKTNIQLAVHVPKATEYWLILIHDIKQKYFTKVKCLYVSKLDRTGCFQRVHTWQINFINSTTLSTYYPSFFQGFWLFQYIGSLLPTSFHFYMFHQEPSEVNSGFETVCSCLL